MVMRIISVICCLTIVSVVFPKNHYIKGSVIVIDGFESRHSFISYVTIDGVKYLLKQKKIKSQQFSVVRDALSAWIAQDLDIAHSVSIIPPEEDFPGKKNKLWPATLHTIAPGKTVRSQKGSKYHALCLKQRVPGGVRPINRWLTETIIHQMTWHKQIPIIIGLDLFLCYTDRHGGNLFYDPATDSFCAIDMENIFRRDLPGLAYEKLLLMLHQGKQFSKKEIEALAKMRDIIAFLLDKYTSKKIIDKLHFFVKQAGFTKNSPSYTEKIKKKIARHERIIIQSRASAYKLLLMLEKIIEHFKG